VYHFANWIDLEVEMNWRTTRQTHDGMLQAYNAAIVTIKIAAPLEPACNDNQCDTFLQGHIPQ
jgi:hypothetical protein